MYIFHVNSYKVYPHNSMPQLRRVVKKENILKEKEKIKKIREEKENCREKKEDGGT